MTKAEKKRRMAQTVECLKTLYPEASCALFWGNDPWRLLVMGRLSAQCTDERVNRTSVLLFKKYPNAFEMANANLSEIEDIVRPCGLYHRKAQDLIASSQKLISDFGGTLPSDMDSLLSFPGVGRKIAHLLRGDVFGLPAIVTDTHCIRIGGRLGYYPENEKTPIKIEKILAELIEPSESSDFCHRIVLFGRELCTARSPRCDSCPLHEKELCRHGKNV